MRKKPTPTYTITAMKNYNTLEFVEVLMGFCEDLMYRTADSLTFMPTVWLLEKDLHFGQRYFVDHKSKKHYMREFEKIGEGNPYANIDLVLIESTAYGIENQVKKSAQTQMLLGIPMEECYQQAFEYWTEW